MFIKPNWEYYMKRKYSTKPTIPKGLFFNVWV